MWKFCRHVATSLRTAARLAVLKVSARQVLAAGAGAVLLGAAMGLRTTAAPLRLQSEDPIDRLVKERALKHRLFGFNERLKRRYGVGLPRLDLAVEDGKARLSFAFTAPGLNHLSVFNSLLEAYHSLKHMTQPEIIQTKRTIHGDNVVYKLLYYTIAPDGGKRNGYAYLVGDTSKGVYKVSLEKEGELGDFELWLVYRASRVCPNLEFVRDAPFDSTDFEDLDEPANPNHRIFADLVSMGCTVVEPHQNACLWGDFVGSYGLKRIVKKALQFGQEDSRLRCVVFEGPRGCGKLFAAKAMAREASVPFVSLPMEKLAAGSAAEARRLIDRVSQVSCDK